MKKAIYLLSTFILLTPISFANKIEFGYNEQGMYVPISIDGQKLEYGNDGSLKPISVGGRKVNYDASGKPQSLGDDEIKYETNENGVKIPVSIGDREIKYETNDQGIPIPKAIGEYEIDIDLNELMKGFTPNY